MNGRHQQASELKTVLTGQRFLVNTGFWETEGFLRHLMESDS